MRFNVVLGIWENAMEFVYSILYAILNMLLKVVDALQDAFMYLAGVKSFSYTAADGTIRDNNLLESLFGIYTNSEGAWSIDFSSPVMKAYWSLILMFVVVLGICIVISIVKIHVGKEDKEHLPSMKKMIFKSGSAVFIVLLLPIFFCLFITASGMIFQFFYYSIIEGMGINKDADLGLAQGVFDSLSTYDVRSQASLIEGWQKKYMWTMSWSDFLAMHKELGGGINGINFILAFIGSCMVLVGMFTATLVLAERLMNIVVLFFCAPVVVGSIPLDDGKRWEQWKEVTLAKVLTAGGNIISMLAFIYVSGMIKQMVDSVCSSTPGDHLLHLALNICYIVGIVAGSFGAAKGGTLIAQLVSSAAGQAEGMSFQASQMMMKAGGALAGALIGKSAQLGLDSIKNKNKDSSSSSSGGGLSGGDSGAAQIDQLNQGAANTGDDIGGNNQNDSSANEANENNAAGDNSVQTASLTSSSAGKIKTTTPLLSAGLGVKKGLNNALKVAKNNMNLRGAMKGIGKLGGLAIAGAAALTIGGLMRGAGAVKNKMQEKKNNKLQNEKNMANEQKADKSLNEAMEKEQGAQAELDQAKEAASGLDEQGAQAQVETATQEKEQADQAVNSAQSDFDSKKQALDDHVNRENRMNDIQSQMDGIKQGQAQRGDKKGQARLTQLSSEYQSLQKQQSSGKSKQELTNDMNEAQVKLDDAKNIQKDKTNAVTQAKDNLQNIQSKKQEANTNVESAQAKLDSAKENTAQAKKDLENKQNTTANYAALMDKNNNSLDAQKARKDVKEIQKNDIKITKAMEKKAKAEAKIQKRLDKIDSNAQRGKYGNAAATELAVQRKKAFAKGEAKSALGLGLNARSRNKANETINNLQNKNKQLEEKQMIKDAGIKSKYHVDKKDAKKDKPNGPDEKPEVK